MSRLSGSQTKQLQTALLSAFGISELKHLVTFEMNQQLENIVPSGPMSSVTFDLIRWAEQQGKTADLIKAVIAARPNNPDVAALAQLLPPTLPTATLVVSAADQRRRLRGALADQFPRESDLAILLDETLGQALGAVAGGQNHVELCFNLVQWLWVDLTGRLKPFLAGAVRERPNNAELKALLSELAAS